MFIAIFVVGRIKNVFFRIFGSKRGEKIKKQ